MSLDDILPEDRTERPRLTFEDLNVIFTATCTMSPETRNALGRMFCEAGLERLSEIEDLLARTSAGRTSGIG